MRCPMWSLKSPGTVPFIKHETLIMMWPPALVNVFPWRRQLPIHQLTTMTPRHSCEVHCHITTSCRPCRRRAVASSDIADGLSRCVTSIWHGVLDFSTPRSHHSHSERYVCGHSTLTSFSHHVHIIHHSHVPLTSHDSDHSVITPRSRGGRRGP